MNEAQRLKGLEDENRWLKHLVADLSLDKEVLKAIVRKNLWSAAGLQALVSRRGKFAQIYPAYMWAKPWASMSIRACLSS